MESRYYWIRIQRKWMLGWENWALNAGIVFTSIYIFQIFIFLNKKFSPLEGSRVLKKLTRKTRVFFYFFDTKINKSINCLLTREEGNRFFLNPLNTKYKYVQKSLQKFRKYFPIYIYISFDTKLFQKIFLQFLISKTT